MAQVVPQRPAVHVARVPAGAGHTVPHAPQLFTSVAVLTHALPHRVGALAAHPEVHAYVPVDVAAQSGVAAGHTTPHAPQLAGAVMSVVHPVVGVAHEARPVTHAPVRSHTPRVHRDAPGRTPGSASQSRPHAPQLCASLCVSTHVDAAPQQVCPLGHAHAHRPATQA